MYTKLIHLIPIILLLGLAGTSTAEGADPDLVGWWKLDETSGTVASDSSGNAYHGTIYGNPQWIVGRVDGALQFDGAGDYVDLPIGSVINSLTDCTVAIWANFSGGGGAWQRIFDFGSNETFNMFLTPLSGAGNLRFAITVTSWTLEYQLNAPSVLATGWHHIAVVINGTTRAMQLYLDGTVVATSSTQVLPKDLGNTTQNWLGRSQYAADPYFYGSLDDVRIYQRVLSQTEIKKLIPPLVKARDPSPPNGAKTVVAPLLQWTAGDTAKYHDVYFGTNPTPGPAEFRGRLPFNMYWHTPGLVPGTTYYWRVDEVEADGVTIYTGDVWSFTAAPLAAYNPNPPDGAEYVSTDADLSWTAGTTADSHDVYFGTVEVDVASGTGGTFKGNQKTTTFEPGLLQSGTTYYWRVDEVEQAGTKRTGNVWRFSTMPVITVTDPNLVGWWKFDEGQGATAIDWSGRSNHGAIRGGTEWVEGYDGGALRLKGVDGYVNLPIGSLISSLRSATFTTWVDFSNLGGAWQRIFDFGSGTTINMFLTPRTGTTGPMRLAITTSGSAGESLIDAPATLATGWHHVAAVVKPGNMQIYLDGVVVASGSTAVVPSDLGQTTNNWLGRSQYVADGYFNGVLDDFRIYNYAMSATDIPKTMRGDPALAWGPRPADGSTTDVERGTPLTWSAGNKAAQHDVYFGTDKIAVRDADKSDTTGIYRGRQAAASYTPPEGLQWGGGPYYWRIDQYNTDGTISRGRLWSFTVADYLIVDDFEDYTDDLGNRIFQTWKDGLGYSQPAPGYPGNGTGSAVGNSVPPYAEQSIVHGGSQSMPLSYDNTGTTGKARYSETQREWASPQDWTRNSVKALALWFYGAPANTPEALYVALEDNAGHVKVVNYPDIEAVQGAGWQEWNIELSQFSAAGVNLKMIKKMYIGLGNRASPKAGGTGTIYIDDIRLYPSRCVPSIGKPTADLSGNCIVDQADVEIIAEQWLDSGLQITPVNPGTAGLVAQYPFNGNANDVVGGHNGTTTGAPVYVAGKIGQAILLNGVSDMVTVGAVGISGAAPRTIAGWSKANATVGALPDWINTFGFTGPAGNNGHFDIELVNVGGNRGYGIHIYGWQQNIMPIDLDWHHLAATFEGTTVRWYGDGRLIGSDSSRVLNTPDNIQMGKRADNDNYWPGRIDEVYIFNRALSGPEIAWLAGYTSAFSVAADLHQDGVINFKDFAVLADSWLDKVFWP